MLSKKRDSEGPDGPILEAKKRTSSTPEPLSAIEVSRMLSFPTQSIQSSTQTAQGSKPFLEAYLGILPPEIRDDVYHNVLIVPSQQGSHNSATQSAGEDHQPHASSIPSCRPSRSDLAILLTCWQIYQEASHILYTRSSLGFANGPDLSGFLNTNGPTNREKLSSLHVEGLLIWQRFGDKYSQQENGRFGVAMSAICKEMADHQLRVLHPKAEQAAKILRQCNNLRKIYLRVPVKEESEYIAFLELVITGFGTVFDVKDDFHRLIYTGYVSDDWKAGFGGTNDMAKLRLEAHAWRWEKSAGSR